MKSKYIILFSLSLIVFSNCKKDDERITDILIYKTWKRGIVDLNQSTNPSGIVSYEIVHDCDKDDTYKFNPDGNLIINRNTEKCDQNELQTEIFNYTINRTTKELVIDGINYTLAEESQSQIKYYAKIPSGTYFSQNLIFLLQ